MVDSCERFQESVCAGVTVQLNRSCAESGSQVSNKQAEPRRTYSSGKYPWFSRKCLLWKCFECQRPRLRDANICRTRTLHFQTRLCGAALLRKQEKTGLMLRLFWRLLYIRPVIWLVDVTINLTSICTIRWSEKSESWNCQKFQAVSERRHHSEFRTVDGIEIRPALLVRCEIGHVCMYV